MIIPKYKRTEKLDPRYQRNIEVSATAEQMGAAIGRGMKGLASGLQSVANDLSEIQEQDDQFEFQKAMLEAESQDSTAWTERVNSAIDGAPGFQKGTLEDYDKRTGQFIESASNPRVQKLFQMGRMKRRAEVEGQAQKFETSEKYNYRMSEIVRQSDNVAQEINRDTGVARYSVMGGDDNPSAPSFGLANFQHGSLGPDKDGFWRSDTPKGQWPRVESNLKNFQSKFYSPHDFRDKHNGGQVIVSKRAVSALDWVTEQFGMGALQINSSYRSPETNVKVAESGPDGPHTHGEAYDIQVRHLDQAQRNKLYSLFKAAGANAFGFGQGAMHVEWRKGKGNGRGGDFEWTYNGAKKYNLVPVVSQAGSVTADWKSVSDYPYMPMLAATSMMETGSADYSHASLTVARDTNGTRSYGLMGLNSGGTIQGFLKNEGAGLGLTAKPGTSEFDAQWKAAVRKNPDKVMLAQTKWHEKHVVAPTRKLLDASGVSFANDPRALFLVSDMVIQYGPGGVSKHLKAGASAKTVAGFINAVSVSAFNGLKGDFKTYLAENPNNEKGLQNRINKRRRAALSIGGMGNGIPKYEGPLPRFENHPSVKKRMSDIKSMIETMGGTPTQRRAVLNNATQKVFSGWIEGVARDNPPAAMAVLQSGAYDDYLDYDESKKLVEGMMAERKKELKLEANLLLADEVAAIRSTGQGLGKLNEDHKSVLSYKAQEELKFAEAQHGIKKRIAEAKVEELPAILEELTPEGDGFAFEQRVREYAEQEILNRQKYQTSDPAGYELATDPKLSESWMAALKSKDPEKIRGAIGILRQSQTDKGVPENMVRSIPQPMAVKHLGSLKNAETSQDALAIISALDQLYGPETGAVLSELEKDGGPKGWVDVHRLARSGKGILAGALADVVHSGSYKDDAKIAVALADAGQNNVARAILEGRMKRVNIKGIEPTGRSTEGDLSVKQAIGSVLGDAFSTSTERFASIREAAMSHYASSSNLGDEFDAARMEQALQAVTGGILKHNDDNGTGHFQSPVPGMSQDEFDQIIAQLGDDDLKGAMWGWSDVRKPVTAEILRDDLQLVSVGNGLYKLKGPDADQEADGFAHDGSGRDYILDLNALLPKLQEKAEKAFQSTRHPKALRDREKWMSNYFGQKVMERD